MRHELSGTLVIPGLRFAEEAAILFRPVTAWLALLFLWSSGVPDSRQSCSITGRMSREVTATAGQAEAVALC